MSMPYLFIYLFFEFISIIHTTQDTVKKKKKISPIISYPNQSNRVTNVNTRKYNDTENPNLLFLKNKKRVTIYSSAGEFILFRFAA